MFVKTVKLNVAVLEKFCTVSGTFAAVVRCGAAHGSPHAAHVWPV